ncbi:MAG TPA: aldehyde ferredoxin oxidoreductase C-terminal domain-containing protein [Thermoguttaceae bacterium]|nr:aldehyde ferredoxin oxidoreductase C-terminal domain-containing protein [Thermoguttaceae bacterium]
MAVIYRVNMTDLTVRVEEPRNAYAELGGRALTSAVVAREVPATCHPLSAENKLVIAPGILTGTGAPCSGRLSVGAKSPLTGTIKESNSGGMAALALAALGIKAIVLEGRPPKGQLYRLVVNKDGLRIEAADALARLGNYETVQKQFDELGDKAACISIGPAGEMLAAAASIAVTDVEGRPTRHCGRGGMGAVMGSKGVKVIVIDPAGGPRTKPADPPTFKQGAKKFAEALKTHPLTSGTLPKYGTNILANVINEAGAYPTRNFSGGQFEGTEAVSGERQHDLILQRGGEGKIAHACHRGCTMKCSRIYVDENGHYVTKGPEYETIWAHGADCGIDDLDAIARMDRMDDDLGIDTIETGATIGVAMEAGVIPFGDAEAAFGLLEEVAKRSPLGRLVASGAQVLGKAFGVDRIPTVKGQSMPAYDPRAIQGIGVTYATSTMGADHTAGYAITANVLGVGGKVDPLKPEGQWELSRNLQIATAAIDAAGLCLFVAFAVLDDQNAMDAVCEMLSGFYGRPFTADDYAALGKQVLAGERRFNAAAGFTAIDDRLPDFFKKERLAPHDVTFTVPDEELDKVHSA